jgi:hypothetical protein
VEQSKEMNKVAKSLLFGAIKELFERNPAVRHTVHVRWKNPAYRTAMEKVYNTHAFEATVLDSLGRLKPEEHVQKFMKTGSKAQQIVAKMAELTREKPQVVPFYDPILHKMVKRPLQKFIENNPNNGINDNTPL